jgi:hypothetical protein
VAGEPEQLSGSPRPRVRFIARAATKPARNERSCAVRKLQSTEFVWTLDYRRLLLWFVVLVVPGGLLLLPLLIADARKQGWRKPKAEMASRPVAALPN